MKKLLIALALDFGITGSATAANLISYADAGLTGASTWKVTETASGAEQLTFTALQAVSTSYVYSTAFTCTNAHVIEGVTLFLYRVGTTGTLSVALSDDNGVTATREVTINTSDLPATTANVYTVVFFKFGSTLTCDGGTDYKVGLKTSSASMVSAWRAASGNWVRLLRTNTAQTAAAADVLYLVGDWTAAATVAARTVTMDSTATTAYGAVQIGDHGLLTYGTTASTNYVLRLGGTLNVLSGGTFNMGTSGTPIPATSTAVLEFNNASDEQFGFEAYSASTTNVYGVPRDGSSAYGWTLLCADASAAATALTSCDTTGWKSGDTIAITTTTRTASQTETKVLNGDASGTTINLTAGLTNAHGGSASTKIQAEIANLTRNVMIRTVTAANTAFMEFNGTAVATIKWARFDSFGDTGNRGIHIIGTGTTVVQYCVITAAENTPYTLESTADNFTLDNTVFYNAGTVASTVNGPYFLGGPVASANWSITNNLVISTATNVYGYFISDLRGTFTGNHAAGNQMGLYIGGAIYPSASGGGTCSGFVGHGSGSYGVQWQPYTLSQTCDGFLIWRNLSTGILIGVPSDGSGNTYGMFQSVTFSNLTAFGNQFANVWITGNTFDFKMSSPTLAGDSTFSTACGIRTYDNTVHGGVIDMQVTDGSLGHAAGSYVTHSTADVCATDTVSTINSVVRMRLYNTLFESTETSGTSLLPTGSFISSTKHDQTVNTHKTWSPTGIVAIETSTVDATPAIKMTPNSASVKLDTAAGVLGRGFLVPVDSGQAITFSVKVQKDGSYNGNSPRMILKRNAAQGMTTDEVVATCSASVGSWTTCTGTTATTSTDAGVFEFVIDCDGTAGNMFVDTASITGATAALNGSFKHWFAGLPTEGMKKGALSGGSLAYWRDGLPAGFGPYSAIAGGGPGAGGFNALTYAP